MTLQPVERRFLAWLAVAVILVTSAPYVFGWLATPQDRTYTGIHRLTPGDIAVYYSFIEQGRQGKPVSENLYSSEPQPVPAVFTPQWYVVGQFANLLHLPTVLAYQLTRISFAVLFLILAYQFLAGIITNPRTRMVAMTVATFATGFGALVPIRDMATAVQRIAIPVDLWVPESFPFISLYHNPLFLMGLCAILGVLLLTERAIDRGDRSAAWLASGLALVLAVIHPYDVFLLAGLLAATWIVRASVDRSWPPSAAALYLRTVMLVLGPAIVALGLSRLVFALQPGLMGWASQNVTRSPAIVWYLPAYLIPLIVAALGVRAAVRLRTTRSFLVLGWAIIVPLLLYLPYFPYQRRMMEGWFLALVILGTLGVMAAWSHLQPHLSAFAQTAIVSAALTLGILLTGITSLTHLAKDAFYASYGSEPVSIPSGLAEAFTWIRDHTDDRAVILARPYDGNLLPGWAGRTVYYGHSDLSAESGRKEHELEQLFRKRTFAAQDFFAREGITHLLVRQDDVEARHALRSFSMPVTPVYENVDATVYQVVGP
jgi:hypothetical protein